MLDQAKKILPELSRLRQDFHRHPELSFQEVRTARVVCEALKKIGGISVKEGIGKTGVVAEIGNGEGPTIAIRADMDALPIQEVGKAEYASVNEGVMHACGHDAHTAMLLGVARLLKDRFLKEDLKGKVRFIFQPAEEDDDEDELSGASRMIEDGALEDLDAVIALHVKSTSPSGTVSMCSGSTSAAVDTFGAWITASGGHGAEPHLATDPIWMLSPVLAALYGIVARRIDPMKKAVLSIGQVHAGTASNIIPHEAYLEGTLRSFDTDVRKQLVNDVEQALSIVRPLGGDFRLQISDGYPAGWNDEVITNGLYSVCADLIGTDAIDESAMGMGAEDFSYMCQEIPGAMFLLGSAIPDGIERGHHTNIFDINENILPIGTAILAETARRFLNGSLPLPERKKH